jgi:hypothetical protein
MRYLVVLFIHLIAVLTQLLQPGGARSLVAESLLLKHQLLIVSQRASPIRSLPCHQVRSESETQLTLVKQVKSARVTIRQTQVKRRQGRRALANFENLPVNTYVYELSAEQRPCPSCGVERKEISSENSCRSSTFRDTSNASSMYARSMRAAIVSAREKIRRSK